MYRVKKWCKGCKTGEREQRKDYFRRVDAEKQAEFEEMQKRLFTDAKKNPINNETGEFDDCEEIKEEEPAEYKFKNIEESERFFAYITDDYAEDRYFTTAFVDELIDFIMAEPDYRIKRFL